MIMIAAMSRDGVIGSGDGMPWDVPAEYQQFLNLVNQQTVIMGRRSWEIFGADLTTAYNIVVSRSLESGDRFETARSCAEAIELARAKNRMIFVAGGAQIYRAMLPRSEALYLSYIEGQFDGDAYFPDFDEQDWEIDARRRHPEFEFIIYRRKTPLSPIS